MAPTKRSCSADNHQQQSLHQSRRSHSRAHAAPTIKDTSKTASRDSSSTSSSSRSDLDEACIAIDDLPPPTKQRPTLVCLKSACTKLKLIRCKQMTSYSEEESFTVLKLPLAVETYQVYIYL